MNYVSYERLVVDVRQWSLALPSDLGGVVGVPRSGNLVATLLALHRNIHLLSLNDVASGAGDLLDNPIRRGGQEAKSNTLLVVDDTVNTGGTLRRALELVQKSPYETISGALYYVKRLPGIQYCYRQIDLPRAFEWNLFHSFYMKCAILDIDGVLCEDWTGQEGDSGDKLLGYKAHLANAKPRITTTYPILGLATGRLERYRAHTQRWLYKYDIKYGEMWMAQHPTAQRRRAANDIAMTKAKRYAATAQAVLFVESNEKQAGLIARISKKPVLSLETNRILT